MGIRQIGRWVYHSLTSSQKRPYIKLSLEEIEGYIADAARRRDTLLLFGAFLELCYRVTSLPGGIRQNKISLPCEEFENISVPNARRSEIDKPATDIWRIRKLRKNNNRRD